MLCDKCDHFVEYHKPWGCNVPVGEGMRSSQCSCGRTDEFFVLLKSLQLLELKQEAFKRNAEMKRKLRETGTGWPA